MYVYWPVSDFHSAAQTQAGAGQGTFFFLLIKNLGIIGACGWANWHALDEPDRWTTKARTEYKTEYKKKENTLLTHNLRTTTS